MRRMNPNAIKLHRTYDVSELAVCCGVHKNTIRLWRRDGLEAIDGSKPALFHAASIRTYLRKRNSKRKCPCGPGKFYCFRCKEPRPPAVDFIVYVPITATSGNAKAICGICETHMFRRVTRAALATAMPGLAVRFQQAEPRLKGCPSPSLTCDFERVPAA